MNRLDVAFAPLAVAERQPPYAPEAEISVLGGMLIDGDAVAKAIEVVDDTMFYREANRRIFRSMTRLFTRGQVVDPVTLREELQKMEELDSVGGHAYLSELLDAVPTAANIEYHARIVRERALLRRLIEASSHIIRDSYEPGERSVEQVLDGAEQLIFQVAQSHDRQSRIYQSPEVETNEGNLTIGVDDVGLLAVTAQAGDLNWTEVERALVTFRYEDEGLTPIEEQFALTQAKTEYKVLKVIFQPVRKNYRYQVKYFMKDGREFEGAVQEGRAANLFINDVFGGRKTISLRGVGDFANRVRTVFVNLEYEDTKNNYRQSKTHALTASTTFLDWTFPVITETGGKVSYSATVDYKNNTREDIPKTVASSDIIILPPAIQDVRTISLVPDLIDWDSVRLVRASLSYADPENQVNLGKDFIFSATNKAATSWTIEMKNKSRTRYTYKATFFLTDGLQKTVGPTETADESLILDPKA